MRDIIVDLASGVKLGRDRVDSLSIKLPKGSPAILVNSLRYKDLFRTSC